jgi:septum formation protein
MEESLRNQISKTSSDASGELHVDSALPLDLPRIVLASKSPRRAEILRTVGWPFETFPVDVDESRNRGEGAQAYVERLACEKAGAAAPNFPSRIVLGADTVVVVDNEILGKPEDESQARRMLRDLGGRWHQVLTGVALIGITNDNAIVAHAATEVKFAMMGDAEIDWYVSTGEPMDKAGAYAIQGLGARFIEEIKGEYFNVMGLPVRLLYDLITRAREENEISRTTSP